MRNHRVTGGAIPEIGTTITKETEAHSILEVDWGRWVEKEENPEEVLRMKESPEEVQKDRKEAFLTRENHEEALLQQIIEIEEVDRTRDPHEKTL